ncbi:hypothetical protein HYH02_000308 [Chlamydomonas schloesseri]|uniref:MYND-type domain-containing protein n=1 Tax=Chlamydomonas schloesseri TaxID=2026947 RepID=A0A835WM80_9CHLO|nr:hypothetical protein HYH02_000308 [Chlamydomonas schloesseri]|eukprot:KAG2450207.1 hypothetical protein HYH02_000308 [Chlamydomonas schloesseri]
MVKTNKRRASLQEQPNKSAAATVACAGCHPLLASPPEGKHELSGEGEDRVEQEPERAPGIDCCAVCANDCATEVLCAGCATVIYCSEEHREEDGPNHSHVCETLRLMRAAEALPALNGGGGGGGGGAAADSKAEPQHESVLEQPPVYRGTPDGFRVPSSAGAGAGAAAAAAAGAGEAAEGAAAAAAAAAAPQEGWAAVIPPKFRAVLGGSAAGEAVEEGGAAAAAAAEGAEDKAEHPRKKARKSAVDGAAGSLKGAAAVAAAKPDSADAQLLLAAQLADRTAELTYVYTAAQALLAAGPAAKVAVAASRSGRALQLVVLGAAEDAELSDLAAWQVVAAALDTDVRVVFVGPQVPERLAGMGAQYGRVAMRFVQATYDEMASGKIAGVDPSSLDSAATVFLAFNPGFTCPDYDWGPTLDAIAARSGSGRAAGAVLVVATNTRVEALMDCELLLERGWRPAGGAEPNPYTSLQARQSGTLANDLYRKNAWLVSYQHVGEQGDEEDEQEREGGRGGRRRRRRALRVGGGGGGPRGAAGRVARALLDTLKKPFKGLMRRR